MLTLYKMAPFFPLPSIQKEGENQKRHKEKRNICLPLEKEKNKKNVLGHITKVLKQTRDRKKTGEGDDWREF